MRNSYVFRKNFSDNIGLAAYKTIALTVDEEFPESGVIRFAVPRMHRLYGDNDYLNDDYIELEYILDNSPDDPEDTTQMNSYGDMNLGRREYRRLHYKKTVEEDDLDKPIMATDPTTGEQKETGEYEKKLVGFSTSRSRGQDAYGLLVLHPEDCIRQMGSNAVVPGLRRYGGYGSAI